MVAMIRNSVGREHSSRAIRLSTSIGVRRFARIEWSWKMRSNLSNGGLSLAGFACILPDASFDDRAQLPGYLRVLEASQQRLAVCHAVLRKLTSELQVFLSARNVLRNSQVVHFET